MTEAKPIYSGEATLRGRGETDKSGRWVRFEIEDFGGVHPFKGLEGERFAVVVMGPLASAEHEPVARKGAAGKPVEAGGGQPEAPPATKPKQRWKDMPHSQRAALRIKEPEFWKYITSARGVACADEDEADTWLKSILDVDSKSKITGPVAHHFDLIDGKFQAWQQAKGHNQL